jgi:hypothetical protein
VRLPAPYVIQTRIPLCTPSGLGLAVTDQIKGCHCACSLSAAPGRRL